MAADPEDVVGFSCVRDPDQNCVRRYILFNDGTAVKQDELTEFFIEDACRFCPHLDREIRANNLPEILLHRLRLILNHQDLNIKYLRQRADELLDENMHLQNVIVDARLTQDGKPAHQAVLRVMDQLRKENEALQPDSPFRESIDMTTVATLEAVILRLRAKANILAPMSANLASHQDPAVRECYQTNLSIVSIFQEELETALEACTHLLSSSSSSA